MELVLVVVVDIMVVAVVLLVAPVVQVVVAPLSWVPCPALVLQMACAQEMAL
jgi:hypothetical protein